MNLTWEQVQQELAQNKAEQARLIQRQWVLQAREDQLILQAEGQTFLFGEDAA